MLLKKCYLLCIGFWFKRDEPVVIIGKLTVDKLRQIISFEKCFNLLRKAVLTKRKRKVWERSGQTKENINLKQDSKTPDKKNQKHFSAYRTGTKNFRTPTLSVTSPSSLVVWRNMGKHCLGHMKSSSCLLPWARGDKLFRPERDK